MIFLYFAITIYTLMAIGLYLGLRPHCVVNGPISAILLAGICFTWIVSLPFAFWYHSRMAKREQDAQDPRF